MKVTTDSCLFGAWVAKEIEELSNQPRRVLDIGAGTGLLSLMVAQKNTVDIDAIEINKEATEQAKENIAASPWQNRIHVIHDDVMRWKTSRKYDCIISNPPFYETELKSPKHVKNIAHHGEGLKLAELFNFIKHQLTEDGVLFLLLPIKRKTELESLSKYGFSIHTLIDVQQTINHLPFRVMIKAGNKKQDVLLKPSAIKTNNDEYTVEFIRLLKDYYLRL